MGLPIQDKPTPYDAEVKPCGAPGSSSDDCALAFDLTEHQAKVYPVNYNRPPPKQPEPNTWKPFGLLPNLQLLEQYENCIRETPILVVKPKSQRYIVLSKTIDFMYSQRFYPKVGEMFIRNTDGSIRTTMKDFLANISRGNVEMQPTNVYRPQMDSGGGGGAGGGAGSFVGSDGGGSFIGAGEYIVGSPRMVIASRSN